MRPRVKLHGSSGGWFCFWAAALLVLPNCFLETSGLRLPSNVNRGEPQHTSAIFCDIERPGGRRCAMPEEPAVIAGAIRLKDAAVALVEGRTSTIGGLDDSLEATGRCSGQPELVEFFGAFPEGSDICLNCGSAIGPGATQHANNAAVCVAACLDLFDPADENIPPSAAALAFCSNPDHVRLSTNFPTSSCYDNACELMGGVGSSFDDPRRHPEPVEWTNLERVIAVGGTLVRTEPGGADAAASSSQLIAGSDGYLEFTATETTSERAAGLSSGSPPAGGIELSDIGFGIRLLDTGEIQVIENGEPVGTFGLYVAGDKFRVKLRDTFNDRAAVSYARINGPCTDGSLCNESVFHTSGNTVMYPVRVDAVIRHHNGTVTDARIVRIR